MKRNALALTLLATTFSISSALADKVVEIGFSAPLSGGAAFYGKDVQTGLDMAIADINKTGLKVGGEKVTFKLVALDDRYLPNETATNVKRLTGQGIKYIFIPHAGGVLTVQPMTTRDPQFMILAHTSEPKVAEANNPLTIILPPLYSTYATPFVKFEMKKFGKKLGLVGNSSAYGKQWAETIAAEWKKQGGTVGNNNAVDYSTTVDFSAAVTKALAEKPDVLFAGGPSQPTALVIKAAREQGFKGGFILMDQVKMEQVEQVIPRAYLDGSVGGMPVMQVAGTQFFTTKYQSLYKRIPPSDAAVNFMGFNLLIKAMELAGTTDDLQKIRAQMDAAAKALPQSKTVYKINGVDSRGAVQAQLIIASVKDGKYTRIPTGNQK